MDDINFKKVEEILAEYGMTVVRDMAAYLSATTNLKRNIKSEVTNGKDTELTVTIPHYGLYVNDGRKPGSKMPPAQPISDWMKAKGIEQKYLYPIRRKIGRDGIKPRPFFHYFYDKLDVLYIDITRALGEEVVTIIAEKFEANNI